jgi:hypothetical protein
MGQVIDIGFISGDSQGRPMWRSESEKKQFSYMAAFGMDIAVNMVGYRKAKQNTGTQR